MRNSWTYYYNPDIVSKTGPSVDYAPLKRWADREWFDHDFNEPHYPYNDNEPYAYFAATETFEYYKSGRFHGSHGCVAIAGPFSTQDEAFKVACEMWKATCEKFGIGKKTNLRTTQKPIRETRRLRRSVKIS